MSNETLTSTSESLTSEELTEINRVVTKSSAELVAKTANQGQLPDSLTPEITRSLLTGEITGANLSYQELQQASNTERQTRDTQMDEWLDSNIGWFLEKAMNNPAAVTALDSLGIHLNAQDLPQLQREWRDYYTNQSHWIAIDPDHPEGDKRPPTFHEYRQKLTSPNIPALAPLEGELQQFFQTYGNQEDGVQRFITKLADSCRSGNEFNLAQFNQQTAALQSFFYNFGYHTVQHQITAYLQAHVILETPPNTARKKAMVDKISQIVYAPTRPVPAPGFQTPQSANEQAGQPAALASEASIPPSAPPEPPSNISTTTEEPGHSAEPIPPSEPSKPTQTAISADSNPSITTKEPETRPDSPPAATSVTLSATNAAGEVPGTVTLQSDINQKPPEDQPATPEPVTMPSQPDLHTTIETLLKDRANRQKLLTNKAFNRTINNLLRDRANHPITIVLEDGNKLRLTGIDKEGVIFTTNKQGKEVTLPLDIRRFIQQMQTVEGDQVRTLYDRDESIVNSGIFTREELGLPPLPEEPQPTAEKQKGEKPQFRTIPPEKLKDFYTQLEQISSARTANQEEKDAKQQVFEQFLREDLQLEEKQIAVILRQVEYYKSKRDKDAMSGHTLSADYVSQLATAASSGESLTNEEIFEAVLQTLPEGEARNELRDQLGYLNTAMGYQHETPKKEERKAEHEINPTEEDREKIDLWIRTPASRQLLEATEGYDQQLERILRREDERVKNLKEGERLIITTQGGRRIPVASPEEVFGTEGLVRGDERGGIYWNARSIIRRIEISRPRRGTQPVFDRDQIIRNNPELWAAVGGNLIPPPVSSEEQSPRRERERIPTYQERLKINEWLKRPDNRQLLLTEDNYDQRLLEIIDRKQGRVPALKPNEELTLVTQGNTRIILRNPADVFSEDGRYIRGEPGTGSMPWESRWAIRRIEIMRPDNRPFIILDRDKIIINNPKFRDAVEAVMLPVPPEEEYKRDEAQEEDLPTEEAYQEALQNLQRAEELHNAVVRIDKNNVEVSKLQTPDKKTQELMRRQEKFYTLFRKAAEYQAEPENPATKALVNFCQQVHLEEEQIPQILELARATDAVTFADLLLQALGRGTENVEDLLNDRMEILVEDEKMDNETREKYRHRFQQLQSILESATQKAEKPETERTPFPLDAANLRDLLTAMDMVAEARDDTNLEASVRQDLLALSEKLNLTAEQQNSLLHISTTADRTLILQLINNMGSITNILNGESQLENFEDSPYINELRDALGYKKGQFPNLNINSV